MFRKVLPLFLILVLATFLRVYQLDKVPPALFGDEIDVGYQAYSLLQTGQDIQGQKLPIYIKSLAEYRAPLYLYSDVPFIKIFGLNVWGVRLSAALWGVISIIGLYLLTSLLTNKKVALITAFFAAISPWHLQYSRAGFEVTMLLSFLLFGSYFFLKGGYFWIISAILLGMTLYIYSTAAVFTPLLGALLLLTQRRKVLASVNRPKLSLAAVGLVIVITPFLWQIIGGVARERFSVVSIFQESVLLDKINLARVGINHYSPDGTLDIINSPVEAMFHNKVTVFSQVFTLNYLRAFSFDFLFGQGDPNYRQSVHELGELYIFDLPLIILGLWALFKHHQTSARWGVTGWLLLAPIPAALTFDGGFHATRLFLMLPPLLILSALGLTVLLTKKRIHMVGLIFFSLLAIYNVAFYFHRYYVHYPIESPRFWQVGFKEAMGYVADNQDHYQTVILNNTYEPALERYLFYSKYDPKLFHQQFTGDREQSDILTGVNGFRLGDKIYFGHLNKNVTFDQLLKPGMLYLASARDELTSDPRKSKHDHFQVVKAVVDPRGEPIFYLLQGQ